MDAFVELIDKYGKYYTFTVSRTFGDYRIALYDYTYGNYITSFAGNTLALCIDSVNKHCSSMEVEQKAIDLLERSGYTVQKIK